MIAIASPSSALFRRLFLPFASVIIRFVREALRVRVGSFYSTRFDVEDLYEKTFQESEPSDSLKYSPVQVFFKLCSCPKY